MAGEFASRHEARQQAYDNMVKNASEESQRQWDAIKEATSANYDNLLDDLSKI